MEYKLFYLGKYGKIAYSNGELISGNKNETDYYEIYTNLDEAKTKAKIFVDKYPLMSCSISNDENDDEIIITADKEKLDKAWKEENEKNTLLFEAYAKEQRRFKYFVVTVCVSICIVLFMLLR